MEDNNILVYIKPGELYVGSEPVIIKTVLGSCISVCLHDKIKCLGGANHYLLPYSKDDANNPLNYGETSIVELIDLVLREGGEKRNLVAQLVGGCAMQPDPVIDVGQANIILARKVLQEHSIPIIFEDVGGNSGRVICFNPRTNELQIRKAGANAKEEKNLQKEDSFVQLTPSQSHFLSNIFSLGLLRARQSLTTMCQTPIEIEVSEVTLRTMGYAQDYALKKFNEFVIGTGTKDSGTIGEVILILDPSKMGMFINALLRRNLATQIRYDRMESSVILEFANIVINGILGTLANRLGFNMVLRVPTLARSERDLNTMPFMSKNRKWKLNLATKTKISVPAWQTEAYLLLLVELNSPQHFFEKICDVWSTPTTSY